MSRRRGQGREALTALEILSTYGSVHIESPGVSAPYEVTIFRKIGGEHHGHSSGATLAEAIEAALQATIRLPRPATGDEK